MASFLSIYNTVLTLGLPWKSKWSWDNEDLVYVKRMITKFSRNMDNSLYDAQCKKMGHQRLYKITVAM